MVGSWLDRLLIENIARPAMISQQMNWSASDARSKYSSVVRPQTSARQRPDQPVAAEERQVFVGALRRCTSRS